MINLLMSTGLIVGISFGCVAVVALAVVLLLILKKPKNDGIVTVSYKTNGGEELEEVSGQAGEHIPVTIPVRHGYLFNGWYVDEALQVRADDSVFPKTDMTFYADWKEYGDKKFEEELEITANPSIAISSSDVAEVNEKADVVSEEMKINSEEVKPKEKTVRKKRTTKPKLDETVEEDSKD